MVRRLGARACQAFVIALSWSTFAGGRTAAFSSPQTRPRSRPLSWPCAQPWCLGRAPGSCLPALAASVLPCPPPAKSLQLQLLRLGAQECGPAVQAATQRDGQAAHGARHVCDPAGLHGQVPAHARPAHPVAARHRPRRHRHPGAGPRRWRRQPARAAGSRRVEAAGPDSLACVGARSSAQGLHCEPAGSLTLSASRQGPVRQRLLVPYRQAELARTPADGGRAAAGQGGHLAPGGGPGGLHPARLGLAPAVRPSCATSQEVQWVRGGVAPSCTPQSHGAIMLAGLQRKAGATRCLLRSGAAPDALQQALSRTATSRLACICTSIRACPHWHKSWPPAASASAATRSCTATPCLWQWLHLGAAPSAGVRPLQVRRLDHHPAAQPGRLLRLVPRALHSGRRPVR